MFMVSGPGGSRPGAVGARGRSARRRDDADARAAGADLRDRWRWVVEGTAAARTSPCVAGGVVISVPDVVAVDLGDGGGPVVLTVRLLAGQLAGDLAAVGHRLAEGLGVAAVRVEQHRHGYVRVTLLRVDPLAGVPAPRSQSESCRFPVDLGHGEDGRRVVLELGSAAHMVVQGATRSGKSVALYGVLSQLAGLAHVEVTGCDPTGLLLAPWTGRGGVVAPSLGTGRPAGHVAVLEALTAEMDARIGRIRPGRDAVDLGAGCPLLVVVLEEYPGLLRVLDADKTLGRSARVAVARLLAEGGKAGVRVVLITQRAEAGVIGGFERGQASHRLSFRVDTADAVKMLHPDVPADIVAGHAVAPDGVALLTAPGVPLRRLRVPFMSYGEYLAAVAGTTL